MNLTYSLWNLVAALAAVVCCRGFGYMLGSRCARFRWLASLLGPIAALGLFAGPVAVLLTLSDPYVCIAGLLTWLAVAGFAWGIAVGEAFTSRFGTLTKRAVVPAYYIGLGVVITGLAELLLGYQRLQGSPEAAAAALKQSLPFFVLAAVYLLDGTGLVSLRCWVAYRVRKLNRLVSRRADVGPHSSPAVAGAGDKGWPPRDEPVHDWPAPLNKKTGDGRRIL